MDLKAQMGQFLAPEFSLAQLAERLYQAETDPRPCGYAPVDLR